MKKIIMTACIVALAITIYAQATEVELVRSAFKTEKKAKVAAFMNLSDSDAKKFWPIYNEYEHDRSALGDRKVKMLELYTKSYTHLDAATAQKLWQESAAIQRSEASLREKYAGIIRKNISPVVALNFYMVEDYIATAVKEELYTSLPTTP